MNDLFASGVRAAVFALSACLALWILIPDYRPEFAGAAFGIAVGVWNSYLLRRRIQLLDQWTAEGKKRRAGTGFAARAATLLLACMAALRFPEHLSLVCVLAGIFFMPFVYLLLGFIRNRS